jgi:hypothetical protein
MKKNHTFRLISFIGVIALTVMSCATIDLANIFATETPTPTLTFTPTPTFTPTLTPTSTPTPTFTPTPTPLPTGIHIEEQADGATLFIDYDSQFQLLIPSGWIAVPLTTENLADLIQQLSQKVPDYKEIANLFKNLDPNLVRGVAIQTDKKYLQDGLTNINILAFEDKLMSSLPLDFVTGALEESAPQNGAKVISTAVPAAKNSHGVEFTLLETEFSALTANNTRIRVRSMLLLFQVNKKLIMIQLTTPSRFGGEFMPVFKQIANSIELLKP